MKAVEKSVLRAGLSGRLFALLVVVVVLACAVSAEAQSAGGGPDDFKLKRGDNEFGFFGGTSTNTPTLIGTTEDAHLTVVALRYGRVFGTKGEVAFEYTIDGVPLALVSQTEFDVRREGDALFLERTRRKVYGAGISPIGFKFNFRRRARVQPFASTSGGLLYFARQVPAPGSSQFNYTFDFSGGVQVLTRTRKAVLIGYKFQHISNANTAPFNPGLDANVIYAGFSVFR